MITTSGTYKGRAKRWKWSVAGSGNVFLAIWFDVEVPAHVDTDGRNIAKSIDTYGKRLMFTEKTKANSSDSLVYMGLEPGKLITDIKSTSEKPTPDELKACGNLHANEVDLQIDMEQAKDKDDVLQWLDPECTIPKLRPVIQWINQPGGGFKTVDATGDQLLAFFAENAEGINSQLARRGIREPKQTSGGAAKANGTGKTPQQAPPQQDSNDDIPF